MAPRIDDLIALVRQDYLIRGRKTWSTAERRSRALRRFFAHREITSAAGMDFVAMRIAEGAAPSTVNKETSVLHRGLVLAQARDPRVSLIAVHRLPERNARTGFVTPAQFAQLHLALRVLDPDAADLVKFLYICGWRSGQAKALTWQAVDPVEGIITVGAEDTKNGRPHTLRLSADVARLIRRRLELSNGAAVFHRKGRPIRSFRGAWRRAAAVAEIPWAIPHDLRRSAARNALLAGCSQAEIKAIAGWRTDCVFYRYAIIDEVAMQLAMDRVARFAIRG